MEQAGISCKALAFGTPENKYKYNGIEKEDAFEIGIYDAQFRELDGQTGRWWQIDPVTDGYENISLYASMYNNPITYSDPLGNEGTECCGGVLNAIGDFGKGLWNEGVMPTVDWVNHNLNPVYGVFNGVQSQVTGTDFLNGQTMTRAEGATDFVLSVIPGAKIEGAIAKTIEKAVVKQEVKQVEKAVVKTAVGTEVKGFKKHAVDRAIERGVKPAAIKDAIKNPLKTGTVVTDKLGRQSQRYVGKTAEVVVNPQTGKIVTVNPTSTKKAAKLVKQAGGE